MLFLRALLFFLLAISVTAVPVSPDSETSDPRHNGIGYKLKHLFASSEPYEHNVPAEAATQRINGIWKSYVLYKATEGEPRQSAKIYMLIQDGMFRGLHDVPEQKLESHQGLLLGTWRRVKNPQRFEQGLDNVSGLPNFENIMSDGWHFVEAVTSGSDG